MRDDNRDHSLSDQMLSNGIDPLAALIDDSLLFFDDWSV